MPSETELVYISEEDMTLPCIICGKQLESALGDHKYIGNHPYRGTTFTTHGHYGSTVFDPMSERFCLELNICDDCLRERHDDIRQIQHVFQPQQFKTYKWTPGHD